MPDCTQRPDIRPKVSKRGRYYIAEMALAQGPRVMADTGDGSYDTLFGYVWLLVLDKVQDRPRLFQAVDQDCNPLHVRDLRYSTVYWKEYSIDPLNHPVGRVRHVSLAFDQAARHVVAYEVDGQQEIWVRQFDAFTNDFTYRGPFGGVDPALINDALILRDTSIADVLLFHLSTDRKHLFYRIQRELYDTPHAVANFPLRHYLDQVYFDTLRLNLALGTDENEEHFISGSTYPYHDYGIAIHSTGQPATSWDYRPLVVIHNTRPYDQGSLSAQGLPALAWDYRSMIVEHDTRPYTSDSAATTGSPAIAWDYILYVAVHDTGPYTSDSTSIQGQPALNWDMQTI